MSDPVTAAPIDPAAPLVPPLIPLIPLIQLLQQAEAESCCGDGSCSI